MAGIAGLVVILILVVMAWVFRDDIRRQLQLFRNFDRLGRNAQGYTEYRHVRTGIVFVLLPGGRFMMGSRASEDASWDERPRHAVELGPFLIAKFEVSQSEWPGAGGAGGDDLPVSNATWETCQTFCNENELRLPSEAQWEYAARGGVDVRVDATALGALAWYGRTSGPEPVGQKEPNAFGLHDTLGNVWEWCEDTYDESYYSRPEASDSDPVCATGLRLRVVRGGSWRSPAEWCRAGFRCTGSVSVTGDQCGLRPVWVFPTQR